MCVGKCYRITAGPNALASCSCGSLLATFGCYEILGAPRTQTSLIKKKIKIEQNTIYPLPCALSGGLLGIPLCFLGAGAVERKV